MAVLSLACAEEAIRQLAGCKMTTTSNAALELFICAKRLEASGRQATISNVNEVVEEVFVLSVNHAYGRIRPFRVNASSHVAAPEWLQREDSGRKTVWNVGTRAGQSRRHLFSDATIQSGLKDAAAFELAPLLVTTNGVHAKPPRQALLVFLCLKQTVPDTATVSDLESVVESKFQISSAELDELTSPNITISAPLVDPTAEWSFDSLSVELKPEAHTKKRESVVIPTDATELMISERLRRMVGVAIRSAPAVLLVGPPGTGKTALLRDMCHQICSAPSDWGLNSENLSPPLWTTAEEGWSSRDLVGGESVVKGEIAFTEGHLLRAISQNRWLAIDELNRADMDRIFGPLFTWLSGDREQSPAVLPCRLRQLITPTQRAEA